MEKKFNMVKSRNPLNITALCIPLVGNRLLETLAIKMKDAKLVIKYKAARTKKRFAINRIVIESFNLSKDKGQNKLNSVVIKLRELLIWSLLRIK